jgi:hypothetical protein
MSLNAVNQVLHALGRRDRIDQLGLSSNGCAALILADGTGVYFEWNEHEQTLHLYSPLTDQPSVTEPLAKAALYRALLGMNCLANGPVIAMHPEQERFYVQVRLAVQELDVQALDQAIDRLTARRHSIREQLFRQGLAL